MEKFGGGIGRRAREDDAKFRNVAKPALRRGAEAEADDGA